MVPKNVETETVAQVIQSMAGEAGFDIKIRVTEFATSLKQAEAGEYQAFILDWSGRIDPDGNAYIFHKTKAPQNYGVYSNPDAELGVSYRSMDDLLAESDVITLHHRFQDGPGGNDAQFDAAAFARMKRGAILVNTARGRLVDETALAQALESGQLRAAALDVYRYEPLPEGHPFYAIPPSRLLLTPHVAGAPNAEAWRLMSEMIVERIADLA